MSPFDSSERRLHRAHRKGSALLMSTVTVGALVLLILALMWLGGSFRPRISGGDAELVVFCAAGIKPPVERVAKEFEKEFGIKIRLDYGPSGGLESKLKIKPDAADIYIPAAIDPYLTRNQKAGRIREVIALAKLHLVLAVHPVLAGKIRTLDDLLEKNIGYVLANKSAAVGRITQTMLEESGDWERIKRGAKVFKPTVPEVANDIKNGGVIQAGFVWDSTAKQFGLEIVELDELTGGTSVIGAGIVTQSKNPTWALRFARYLAAGEKGQPAFKKSFYEPVMGDPWAERPKIVLYSGGLNRLAIQDTIKAFQKREGCEISVVYNGCGTLVGMMNAGQDPDAYFACDISYLKQVQDRFQKSQNVSETEIVMLVRNGNPKDIQSLNDLGKVGLKLGMADEELTALGGLTVKLLKDAGVYDSVVANRVVTSPTADFLVMQMTAHDKLDAVLVYKANCTYVESKGTLVELKHPLKRAIQPFAIHREATYPRLVERLLDAIHSAQSRKKFESLGFKWASDQNP